MPQENPWYVFEGVEIVDSPALVIYRHRVKQNIAEAIKTVGDVRRLRPHVKTHKSIDVTRLMLEAGITGFKCATIAEAEMLGEAGAPDVLLAYQPVGPKAVRFAELTKQYPATRYACLVDNIDAATDLAAIAKKNALTLLLFLDVNVGMNRTGIQPDDSAITLFEKIKGLEHVQIVGLHAYDGHINDTDLTIRKERCHAALMPAMKMKDSLVSKGYHNLTVVAGGSPTFPIHATNKDVECSPGTFAYWDAGYAEAFPDQAFHPAAFVITRIVSFPADDLICTDLGHKSIAAESPLLKRFRFLNANGLEAVSQSEEHLVLKNTDSRSYKIGDVLYVLPVHICPTVALYERAVIIDEGRIVGEWKTSARDKKLTL